ncbi:MAG: FAD-binding oxidoreductase [Myxococcota bacterium]
MDLDRLRARVDLDDSPRECLAHARDTMPRATLALATRSGLPPAPAAVAFPRDEDEVAACLAWAEEEGVAVVPYGAGSGVGGGASGMAGAIALDTKRMSLVGPVTDGAVRAGAGVIGQHLEDALEAQGFATRHSPSSIWCSTVGAWAAGRSAGQFSSRYGKFEDMVLATRVVAPRARYGTGAWADGEDLQPWVLGTEGQLGVVTEVLVRVNPVAQARRLSGWRFATVEAAWGAMRAVMQGDLHPAVLRLYDPVDTRLAGRGTATKANAGGRWLAGLRTAVESIPGMRQHLLALPLALPRLVNQLAQNVASGTVLIAGWEGDGADVDLRAELGERVLAEHGEPLGPGPGEHWYAHRHDVSYKMAPVFSHGGFADTMEVAATWSRLGGLYAGVREALGRHAVVMAHFSHAYAEGCSIYFTFAGTGSLEVYDAAWRDGLAAAAAAGGTVAHHHGVGTLKMHAAARELAGAIPRFRELKARLDPKGVLNPGRLFPDVDVAEPSSPEPSIDAVSRVATLPAQAPAAERDAWLAERGWALRFPTDRPLAHALRRPRAPWEAPVLGACVHTPRGRAVFVDVPRSSAGPDPRETFPPDAYETLTVPVVPLGEPAVVLATHDRPTRRLPDGTVELRGPFAEALARGSAA